MIRLVSWNMNHWQRSRKNDRGAAWDFLRSLEPDIALLQEAFPPMELRPNQYVCKSGGIDSRRKWGSMVVSFRAPVKEIASARSRYSSASCDLHRTHSGTVAVAQVAGLTVISMYGLIESG